MAMYIGIMLLSMLLACLITETYKRERDRLKEEKIKLNDELKRKQSFKDKQDNIYHLDDKR